MKCSSAIWNNLRKIEKYFIGNLKWSFQTGNRILIGINPIMSGRETISISDRFLFFFHGKGFFTWDKLMSGWQGPLPIWKLDAELNLPDSLSSQWHLIRIVLRSCSSIITMPRDFLIWNLSNANFLVCVKNIYVDMIGSRSVLSYPSFPSAFWNIGCTPKYIYFSWLVFYNKNLSWENLRKKLWHGPSRCQMCKLEEESNLHMFFQCNSM